MYVYLGTLILRTNTHIDSSFMIRPSQIVAELEKVKTMTSFVATGYGGVAFVSGGFEFAWKGSLPPSGEAVYCSLYVFLSRLTTFC